MIPHHQIHRQSPIDLTLYQAFVLQWRTWKPKLTAVGNRKKAQELFVKTPRRRTKIVLEEVKAAKNLPLIETEQKVIKRLTYKDEEKEKNKKVESTSWTETAWQITQGQQSQEMAKTQLRKNAYKQEKQEFSETQMQKERELPTIKE